MKIILTNVASESTTSIDDKIRQTAESVFEKMIVDHPELEGKLSVDNYDIEAIVKVRVDGMADTQLIFTDRMLTPEIPEILTLLPTFDANGKLEGTEDNLNDSFQAPIADLMAELPEDEIESEYDTEGLPVVSVEELDLLKSITFKLDEENFLEQYFNDGVLVAELVTRAIPE